MSAADTTVAPAPEGTPVEGSDGLLLEIDGQVVPNYAATMVSFTEGDVVSVLNLQSKRTVTGVVVGRGQVAVSIAPPRAAPETTSSLAAPSTAPVSVANANPQAAAKTE